MDQLALHGEIMKPFLQGKTIWMIKCSVKKKAECLLLGLQLDKTMRYTDKHRKRNMIISDMYNVEAMFLFHSSISFTVFPNTR